MSDWMQTILFGVVTIIAWELGKFTSRKMPKPNIKGISFFWAWYDCWIGVYVDRSKRTVYICPLPCCVVKVERNP